MKRNRYKIRAKPINWHHLSYITTGRLLCSIAVINQMSIIFQYALCLVSIFKWLFEFLFHYLCQSWSSNCENSHFIIFALFCLSFFLFFSFFFVSGSLTNFVGNYSILLFIFLILFISFFILFLDAWMIGRQFIVRLHPCAFIKSGKKWWNFQLSWKIVAVFIII